MSDALILSQPDAYAESHARQLGLTVLRGYPLDLEFDRALIVGSNATIPWALVGAGFRLLEHWDAACPLWRAGVLAQDLGTEPERERTRVHVRDLRLPVYAPELLFVRRNAAGRALLATWYAECEHGDPRLAFIRALYQVKPLFCALPANWLAEARGIPTRPAGRGNDSGLINVEIAPGHYVRCFASEAEKVKKRLLRNSMSRKERKANADHD